MANKKEYPNLTTPTALKTRFSGEKAVQNGRKGGRKKGENAQVKKYLSALLQDKAVGEFAKTVLKSVGNLKKTPISNKEVLASSIFLNAIQGNAKFTELLLKLIGEMPQETINIIDERQNTDLMAVVKAIQGVKSYEEKQNKKPTNE